MNDVPHTPDPSTETAPSAGTDSDQRLVQRLQRAWRDTVGAYATDDGETKNLMHRLVEFGAISREQSVQVLSGVKARVDQNRKDLDRLVDDSIRRATERLTIPSAAELQRLRARVQELEERVSAALKK
ncbi:MAG: phasin family protein [Myxococcota bacterium]